MTDSNQRINSRSGGWSQSTRLVTGRTASVNSLQFSDNESSEFTVQFEIAGSTATAAIQCEATVCFQCEGNKAQRRISIVNGVSITGRGQGVMVLLKDNTSPLLRPSPLELEYTVDVLASRGVRAFSGYQPILRAPLPSVTSGGASISSAGSFPIPATETRYVGIPQDAGAFSAGVFICSSVIPPIVDPNVIVTARSSIFPAVALKIWNPFINPGYMPLPPGADELVIVNASGTAVYASVDYGIEG